MVGHVLRKSLLGAIVGALVITGCGGSESGGKPLSASAYAKKAEAICQKTSQQRDEKVRQVVKENSAANDQQQLTALSAHAVKPIFQEMVAELEELEPPAGEKGDEYREWVVAVEEAVDKIEAPDPENLEASVSAHHAAARAGLEACSVL